MKFTYFSLAGLAAAGTISFDRSLPSTVLQEIDFDDWMAKHDISFTQDEAAGRLKHFLKAKEFVKEHNQKYLNGEEEFYVSLNKFAAMPQEEFLEKYTQPTWEAGTYGESNDQEQPVDGVSEFSCPTKWTGTSHSSSWDGKSNGLVTNVKDQGSCGSCWTFGAGAAIESYFCKKGTKKCSSWNGVSTQQILDCASSNSALNPYGNSGCNGGFQSNALRYVYDFEKGIMNWDDYGYEAVQRSCRYSKSKSIGTFKSCGRLGSSGSANNMFSMMENNGVATVAIDASGLAFQMYDGGLYTGGSCSKSRLNHAVTATAFGKTSGVKSLTIKNSWGTGWGDKGFIHFDATSNTCGVLSEGQYAK